MKGCCFCFTKKMGIWENLGKFRKIWEKFEEIWKKWENLVIIGYFENNARALLCK